MNKTTSLASRALRSQAKEITGCAKVVARQPLVGLRIAVRLVCVRLVAMQMSTEVAIMEVDAWGRHPFSSAGEPTVPHDKSCESPVPLADGVELCIPWLSFLFIFKKKIHTEPHKPCSITGLL